MMAAAPFAIPLDVSQSVATYLGLEPGQMCLVREANDAWLFHFWGAIYGTLLSEVLQIENSGSRPTYSNSIRRAGRFSPQERWQFDAELEADGYPESEEDDEVREGGDSSSVDSSQSKPDDSAESADDE